MMAHARETVVGLLFGYACTVVGVLVGLLL